MRKAKMSFQSGQVKQVIRTYAVEIQTSDKKELDAELVTMKLRKAMGANCRSLLFRKHRSIVELTASRRRSPRLGVLSYMAICQSLTKELVPQASHRLQYIT